MNRNLVRALKILLITSVCGISLMFVSASTVTPVALCQGGCVGYYCDEYDEDTNTCYINRCLDEDCTRTRTEVSAPIRCSCACTSPYHPNTPPTQTCQCRSGWGGCGADIIAVDPLLCSLAAQPKRPTPTPTPPPANPCSDYSSPVPPGTTCDFEVQGVRLSTDQEPRYPVVVGQDYTGRGFTLFTRVDPGWTSRYVARKCSDPDESWQIGGCCEKNCTLRHRCPDECKVYDENGNYTGRCSCDKEPYWDCPYCLARDFRQDEVSLIAYKLDLCGSSKSWISNQLSNRYPLAEVKGEYDPSTWITLCAGAGNCSTTIPIRHMPEDPGSYCFTFHVETTGTCRGEQPCPQPHRPPQVISGELDGSFRRKVDVYLRDTALW